MRFCLINAKTGGQKTSALFESRPWTLDRSAQTVEFSLHDVYTFLIQSTGNAGILPCELGEGIFDGF